MGFSLEWWGLETGGLVAGWHGRAFPLRTALKMTLSALQNHAAYLGVAERCKGLEGGGENALPQWGLSGTYC